MKSLIFLIFLTITFCSFGADSLFVSVQNGSLTYSEQTQNLMGDMRGDNIYLMSDVPDTNFLPVQNGSLKWSTETISKDGKTRGKNVYVMNPLLGATFWDTTNHIFHNIVPTNDSTIQVLFQGNTFTWESVGAIPGIFGAINDTCLNIFIGDVNSIYTQHFGINVNTYDNSITLNATNGVVVIGDVFDNGNGTYITIDDASNGINLTAGGQSTFNLSGDGFSFGSNGYGIGYSVSLACLYFSLNNSTYCISVDENGFLKGSQQ